MRFSFDIMFIHNKEIRVPVFYRRRILALFKEALKRYSIDVFNSYWENPKNNISKPFTYSLHIPHAKAITDDNDSFITAKSAYIRVFVSSSDTEFILHLYNALIKTDYSPFNDKSKLCHFDLHKESPIYSNTCTFKTFSPIVVRKTENRKGTGYLVPEDNEFINSLTYAVHNSCKQFIENYSGSTEDISITIDKHTISKVPHYKEVIPGISGEFTISAPTEVLKLIYAIGLGARRSQGFGMVEVVK